jgi:UDP-N-acetylglucosamine:LPS N-acetylglucosamine transferase
MILKPSFYRKIAVDRTRARTALGFDSQLPTGIVLFGGQGSSIMLDLVRRIDRGRCALQLIVICGNNQGLLSEMRALQPRFPLHVEGFTPRVDYYMALSDFFIGKPGPGSISEALQFHLPVIVECNGRTLPQERYNAQWIREKGVGVVLESFREINAGLSELLGAARFADFQKQAAAYSNHALEEIPEFLEHIASCGPTVPDSTVIADSRVPANARWLLSGLTNPSI